MSPRPYKTDTFHPPALFTPISMNKFCMYTQMFYLFPPCGIYMCLGTVHIYYLRMRSFRTTYFKVKRLYEVILSSM